MRSHRRSGTLPRRISEVRRGSHKACKSPRVRSLYSAIDYSRRGHHLRRVSARGDHGGLRPRTRRRVGLSGGVDRRVPEVRHLSRRCARPERGLAALEGVRYGGASGAGAGLRPAAIRGRSRTPGGCRRATPPGESPRDVGETGVPKAFVSAVPARSWRNIADLPVIQRCGARAAGYDVRSSSIWREVTRTVTCHARGHPGSTSTRRDDILDPRARPLRHSEVLARERLNRTARC